MYESTWTHRFPEHFARLDEQGRWAVTQVLASGHLEGWEPEDADVSDLVEQHLGVLSIEQAQQRLLARARAQGAQRLGAGAVVAG